MSNNQTEPASSAPTGLSGKHGGQASNTYVGFDAITPFQEQLRKRMPGARVLLLLLVFFVAFTGLANGAMVPSINVLAHDFNTSLNRIQAIVPYFVMGNGIGLFLWGPTIDRFGRKTIIVVCGILAIGINTVITLLHDYSALMVARVLQGIFYAGMGAVPSVVLKDVYSPREFVIYNSWLITLFLFTPALAPLFGGWILLHLTWHWVFHIISIVVILAVIAYVIKVPETLDPEKRQPLNTMRIIKNYGTIITSPQSLWLLVLNAIFAVTIFGPPTLLPALAIGVYHIDSAHYGYVTLPIIGGIIIGVQINQFMIKRGVSPVTMWVTGSLLQFATLAFTLYVMFYQLHIVWIIASVSLTVVFNGFQIGNTMVLYLMRYPYMTGTASSMLNGFRIFVAGVIANMVSHLPLYNGVTLLVMMVAVISICTTLSLGYNLIWRTGKDKKATPSRASS